mmetsp:Transcript_122906/g.212607  ORF Transcript_122906/g.212607 Transcript_122906/m.212607 type:complete len:352 (-) Transcript_122906:58-1113(-)
MTLWGHQRLRTATVFGATVGMMALKPMMIHITRGTEATALPPRVFLLWSECFKVLFCLLMLAGRRSLGLSALVWGGISHTQLFSVPATVYLVSNMITVYNARLLEPSVFQLLASTKIIATAAASVFFLGRALGHLQWFALVLVSVGVAMGQQRETTDLSSLDTPRICVFLMLFNSCLSAVAGILAEKALKSKESSCMSIFATNLHMATHTIIVNGVVLIGQALYSGQGFLPNGLPSRVSAVALASEALNGILVSMLMRDADSIVKNYAFTVSTFIVAGLSTIFFGYNPRLQLLVGAGLTLVSVVLYVRGHAAKQAASKPGAGESQMWVSVSKWCLPVFVLLASAALATHNT